MLLPSVLSAFGFDYRHTLMPWYLSGYYSLTTRTLSQHPYIVFSKLHLNEPRTSISIILFGSTKLCIPVYLPYGIPCHTGCTVHAQYQPWYSIAANVSSRSLYRISIIPQSLSLEEEDTGKATGRLAADESTRPTKRLPPRFFENRKRCWKTGNNWTKSLSVSHPDPVGPWVDQIHVPSFWRPSIDDIEG